MKPLFSNVKIEDSPLVMQLSQDIETDALRPLGATAQKPWDEGDVELLFGPRGHALIENMKRAENVAFTPKSRFRESFSCGDSSNGGKTNLIPLPDDYNGASLPNLFNEKFVNSEVGLEMLKLDKTKHHDFAFAAKVKVAQDHGMGDALVREGLGKMPMGYFLDTLRLGISTNQNLDWLYGQMRLPFILNQREVINNFTDLISGSFAGELNTEFFREILDFDYQLPQVVAENGLPQMREITSLVEQFGAQRFGDGYQISDYMSARTKLPIMDQYMSSVMQSFLALDRNLFLNALLNGESAVTWPGGTNLPRDPGTIGVLDPAAGATFYDIRNVYSQFGMLNNRQNIKIIIGQTLYNTLSNQDLFLLNQQPGPLLVAPVSSPNTQAPSLQDFRVMPDAIMADNTIIFLNVPNGIQKIIQEPFSMVTKRVPEQYLTQFYIREGWTYALDLPRSIAKMRVDLDYATYNFNTAANSMYNPYPYSNVPPTLS